MNDAATKSQETEPVIEVYPAFTVESPKADIIDHLKKVHGLNYIRHQSITGNVKNVKLTRETLIEVHDAIHRSLDAATWKWVERARYDSATGTYMGTWIPFDARGQQVVRNNELLLPHTHTDPLESAELRAAATAARSGGKISDKALPAAQIRMLGSIVQNDFRIIEQEMREFAAESLETRRKEIRDEFKGRDAAGPKFKKKVDAAHEKLREQVRKIIEDAAEAGIELTMQVPFTTSSFKVKGLSEALREAEEENKNAITRALSRLEREKAVALRRVQLAGISPEAVKLLDELPDARQMMLESQVAKPKELG